MRFVDFKSIVERCRFNFKAFVKRFSSIFIILRRRVDNVLISSFFINFKSRLFLFCKMKYFFFNFQIFRFCFFFNDEFNVINVIARRRDNVVVIVSRNIFSIFEFFHQNLFRFLTTFRFICALIALKRRLFFIFIFLRFDVERYIERSFL